jgi:hypothetical protein
VKFTDRLTSLLITWNGLCLDVPSVGAVWLLVLTHVSGMSIWPQEAVILWLAIWQGYVADRLLDVMRYPKDQPLPLRHQILHRYRHLLMMLWIFSVIIGLSLSCILLEWRQVLAGIVWALLVGIYCLLVYQYPKLTRILIPREIMVAVIFSCSAALLPWCRLESHQTPLYTAIVIMMASCLMNLIAISIWEYPRDLKLQETSLATTLGPRIPLLMIGLLSCMVITLGMIMIDPRVFRLAMAGIICQLLITGLSTPRIPSTMKLPLADWILFLPVLLLWM